MTNTATQTVTPGTLATIIAAPGYPTEATVIITAVNGRTIEAAQTTATGIHAPEVYTLRRNGKYAAKGSGQWANYLRIQDGAA